MTKRNLFLMVIVVVLGGLYYSYRINQVSSSPALNKIISSLGSSPTSWQNAKVTGTEMADDLIQVCVDQINSEALSECEYIEYWTNNRSGAWQLIGSYGAGQEGLSTCEDWEKEKVANGMSCLRWGGADAGWLESTVNLAASISKDLTKLQDSEFNGEKYSFSFSYPSYFKVAREPISKTGLVEGANFKNETNNSRISKIGFRAIKGWWATHPDDSITKNNIIFWYTESPEYSDNTGLVVIMAEKGKEMIYEWFIYGVSDFNDPTVQKIISTFTYNDPDSQTGAL